MTDTQLVEALRAVIRDVPDFPKPGIVFKDITPLLAQPRLLRRALEAMTEPFAVAKPTHVVAIESRGFILGAPIALALDAAFVPVRKVGKLPFRTERVEYLLEYGKDALEIHTDACPADARVLLVDDVLATGGTAAATCSLVEGLGARIVGCSFLMRLAFLDGEKKLQGRPSAAVITY